MKIPLILLLLVFIRACSADVFPPDSQPATDAWKIEVRLENGTKHTLTFECKTGGRGYFIVQDSRSNLVEPAEPKTGKWIKDETTISFSGPIEFPIGNVGREQGALLLKGIIQSDQSISGNVSFFPTGIDPNDPKATPTKRGTFRATRGN